MARWRGPHESGEFHTAADRLAVMDAEDTWLSVNYPTLLLQWPLAKDPALNQALTRAKLPVLRSDAAAPEEGESTDEE